MRNAYFGGSTYRIGMSAEAVAIKAMPFILYPSGVLPKSGDLADPCEFAHPSYKMPSPKQQSVLDSLQRRLYWIKTQILSGCNLHRNTPWSGIWMNGEITRDNNSLGIFLGPGAAELPAVAPMIFAGIIISEAVSWSRSGRERQTREKSTQIKASDIIILQDSWELYRRHRKLMKEMNDWKLIFFFWADVTAIFEAWSHSLRIGSYLRDTNYGTALHLWNRDCSRWVAYYHIKKFYVKYFLSDADWAHSSPWKHTTLLSYPCLWISTRRTCCINMVLIVLQSGQRWYRKCWLQ